MGGSGGQVGGWVRGLDWWVDQVVRLVGGSGG